MLRSLRSPWTLLCALYLSLAVLAEDDPKYNPASNYRPNNVTGLHSLWGWVGSYVIRHFQNMQGANPTQVLQRDPGAGIHSLDGQHDQRDRLREPEIPHDHLEVAVDREHHRARHLRRRSQPGEPFPELLPGRL